ncbi:NXPE family member 3-like [Argopecten irradians]|uniref:NXPE family member 3-like n=1 Tax=Argopecten irradians TaxID=31199 RepID=UPI00371BCBE5
MCKATTKIPSNQIVRISMCKATTKIPNNQIVWVTKQSDCVDIHALYQLRTRVVNSKYGSNLTIPNRALERINDFLQYTDFDNYPSLVNISTSLVSVRRTKFRVGDEIIVDIVLYNGRGERATVGGDMLRVWLRETTLKASVAGYVIDHGNGSYTGFVKAIWAGNPELMFSIGNIKEHIGIYVNVVKRYGVLEFQRAVFKRHNVNETTSCSVVPNIPDVQKYCNFTSKNFNLPYFCGKPESLNCEDWFIYEGSGIYACNQKHESFFRNYRNLKKTVAVLNILERVDSTQHLQDSCRDVSSRITWHTTNPTGYFYNGLWQSSICKSRIQWEYKHYRKCLRNRPVLLTGDSTTRNWFTPLAQLLRLKIMIEQSQIHNLRRKWHTFSKAVNANSGISLYWSPHEFPFYSNEQQTEYMRSVASRIDELPSNKSSIVILHWFAHLTRTTPKRYRDHIRSSKKAVLRLLERSPNSDIFIKGPHSFTYEKFLEPFDYVSGVYKQILYEEFRDSHDKVYFIDQWDATVGNENENVHPTFPFFNEMMLNFLFSFIC